MEVDRFFKVSRSNEVKYLETEMANGSISPAMITEIPLERCEGGGRSLKCQLGLDFCRVSF